MKQNYNNSYISEPQMEIDKWEVSVLPSIAIKQTNGNNNKSPMLLAFFYLKNKEKKFDVGPH